MSVVQISKVPKAPHSSKASKQAKACALSINTTDIQVDGSAQSTRVNENVAQAAAMLSRESDVAKTLASSKKRALLNTNWRGNHLDRLGGMSMIPITAAPEKTEFQLDGGKKNINKLSIDTGRAGEYGIRRYRDTPIDPDFIFSAPITKKDFEGTLDQSDAYYDDEKPEEQEPVNKATLPTPTPATNKPAPPMFAEIKAFKSAKQMYWNKNEMPHTAGLPVDRLRTQLEEALTLKAILEESVIEASASGKAVTDKKPEGIDSRYQALLAKLRKPNNRHRRALSYIDIKPPHWTKESDISTTQLKSPSPASAISGLPDEGVKKGPMLNPQATEFRSSISPLNANAPILPKPNNQQEDGKVELTHQAMLPFSSTNNSPNNEAVLLQEVRAVHARMAELMEEMKELKAQKFEQQHPTHPLEQSCSPPFINQPQYDHRQVQVQGPATTGQYGSTAWPVTAPYNALQNNLSLPQPSYSPQNMGLNGGISFPLPPHSSPFQGHQLPRFSSPSGLHAPVAPMGPMAPMTLGPEAGYGSVPLHAQAQMIFGPKPVNKPRPNFRPGDPRAAAAQVAYESYLEQKRASNINYAMQCRERQAKRAERQKGNAEPRPQAQRT
ncbi:hypothetical protein GGR52DRAFT_588966 [Hypoxylon sp. FL1284]|nr:hypothetical protein GGR52DRAFT_588966 [Hypoxylon sp. FL1284]